MLADNPYACCKIRIRLVNADENALNRAINLSSLILRRNGNRNFKIEDSQGCNY